MSAVDSELYRRAARLLEPGDIDLHGAVVHTDYGGDEESLLHQATLDVGDVVADHRGVEEWHVHSGNDDPEFGLNQHQGRTAGGEFVWECQQLLREGTFDVVVDGKAGDDLQEIVADIRAAGHDAVGITEDGATDEGSRVA
jgi:hypothetical protein